MARRGGAQQLQVDVRTDEDLEKFLTRNGLLSKQIEYIEIYPIYMYVLIPYAFNSTGGLLRLVWSVSGHGQHVA